MLLLFRYFPFFRLLLGVRRYGFSFFTLLYSFPCSTNKISIGTQSWSNDELLAAALQQAFGLQQAFAIQPKDKVVLIGNNSIEWLLQLLALSGLGADVFLINPKMKATFIHQQLTQIDAKYIWIDAESQALLQAPQAQTIDLFATRAGFPLGFLRRLRNSKGSINNLSSGSSGWVKKEKRKLRIRPFLSPFLSLIKQLKPYQNKDFLIGISCSHGYGLASMLLGISLKGDIVLTANDAQMLHILQQRNTDCWIALPSQIEEVLKMGFPTELLPQKIITGSEPIQAATVKTLIDASIELFNIYGTTETGILCIAYTAMLRQRNDTIGKPLKGVRYKFETSEDGASQLWVKTGWSAEQRMDTYTATGDCIRIDEAGFWYHEGRIDGQFLSKGHLVAIPAIEALILQHFPELQLQVVRKNQQTYLYISNELDSKEKNKTEMNIQRILPSHLRPKEIFWEVGISRVIK